MFSFRTEKSSCQIVKATVPVATYSVTQYWIVTGSASDPHDLRLRGLCSDAASDRKSAVRAATLLPGLRGGWPGLTGGGGAAAPGAGAPVFVFNLQKRGTKTALCWHD